MLDQAYSRRQFLGLAGGLASFVGLGLVGCGGAAAAESVAGEVTYDGASSFQALVEAAAEKFMDANPDVSVSGSGNGSGKGLTAVAAGTVTIGNSDVFAETKLEVDQVKNLVDHEVAVVGMGPVVSKNVKVDDLSLEQLKGIFSGQITNWKEVGGADAPIVAFQRGVDSGSQTLFKKLLIDKGDGQLMTAPTELAPADMGGLVDRIAEYNNSANAIGFSVYYYIDQMYSKPGLRLLAVDGVTPGNDTIASESYPLCNEFYAVIHGNAAPDSPQRKVYDWLDTDEGRRCIEKAGYVALSVTPQA